MKIRALSAAVCAAALLTATTACSSPAPAADGGGGEGGEVTVGAILSMSGVYSTLGPAQKNAIEMGVEALNETGFEVAGKTYTLAFDYADDKSDPATTGVAALRQMVESDALPVIAFGLGSSTYAPQLERTPVPMINILDSTFPSILDYSDQIVLMRGASETYTIGCVEWAEDVLGASAISIIDAKGEPYGEGLTLLMEQQGTDAGLDVTVSSAPLGTADYGSAISAALAADPDVVYLSSVTGVILPVLKQLRQAGYAGAVMHSAGVNPQQAEAILGDGFNELMADNYDCAGTTPLTADSDATRAFAEAYQERYDEYPQDLTMWSYDLPFVIAAAMSMAGTTTDRAAIGAALAEIEVPAASVSGWIASPDDALFADRNARTLSEVTQWCTASSSIATALVFDGLGGEVGDATVIDDPCSAG
ncbi:ABC transporter substrate-binding protein [Microbacterium sp. 2FI]|uniref:ABC transporter substrate-binding protein n=1 Tax=Microbacterium sp. 2FI TaxID=2502193 RepID=UPI0010F91F38|nr:ABC transporter substrate-binding protein [Microbacterium sp. 2FI]